MFLKGLRRIPLDTMDRAWSSSLGCLWSPWAYHLCVFWWCCGDFFFNSKALWTLKLLRGSPPEYCCTPCRGHVPSAKPAEMRGRPSEAGGSQTWYIAPHAANGAALAASDPSYVWVWRQLAHWLPERARSEGTSRARAPAGGWEAELRDRTDEADGLFEGVIHLTTEETAKIRKMNHALESSISLH